MTRFVYEEYQTVHVRDVVRVDLDDFIMMMSGTESGLAYWADGALFVCYMITESEELARMEISGITYIDRIVFAKHPQFSKTIKSTTNLEIPAVNVGRSSLYSGLVQWLKSLPAWNN